jgi:hypothetical protein
MHLTIKYLLMIVIKRIFATSDHYNVILVSLMIAEIGPRGHC